MTGSAFGSDRETELYGKFMIEVDGVCRHVKGGNPAVEIDPDYLDAGGHIVDFSGEGANMQDIGVGQDVDSVKLFTRTDYYESNTVIW